ncbi:MAG: AarF/ABC1/UbiB kinase family protein [Bacteriovorax sp.]|nr:AarF/ABC1/UbiB kinase family protein [Bacteriovorax sp.]
MSEFKSSKLSRLFTVGKGLTKATATLAFDAAKNRAQTYLDNHQNDLKNIKDLSLKIKASKEIIVAMGELKGAMMKLGQMISISEDLFLPKEISELFKDLQKNSPSMSPKDVEAVLQNSFQKSSKELFLEFDEIPIASASIGQVHKARLKTGEIVAIKIQYPKIVEAIKHDFQNLHQIDNLLHILFPNKPNLDSLIEELKISMYEECDYAHELSEMIYFKQEYEKHFPQIYIPKVFPEFSSSTILTMEFVEGDSFEETLLYTDEERNFLGQMLYNSFLHSLWNLKRLHTDPQNGNYLFKRDKIIMLDFGSTRSFDHEFISDYCDLMMSLEENNSVKYGILCKKLEIFKVDEKEDFMLQHFLLIQEIYLPYIRPGIFPVVPISPFALFKELIGKVDFKGRSSPKREFLLLDRSTFGLYTKLLTWKSEIDWLYGKNTFRNSIENEVKSKYQI